MNLTEALRERLADGRPFGFCPWEDGDGHLWGSLIALKDSGFQVQLIGTLGETEEIEWREFHEVYYFEFGEKYTERLHRLRDFTPTRPNAGFYKDALFIERILHEVAASGAVAHVKFHGEDATSTIRVVSIEDGWVTMRDYDDLMQPYGLLVHRLSNITEIRAGTVHEEADEFVERFGQ